MAPLVEGGELKEYSAHLIPEGGWDMMPELGCPGLLVTGDAAALCLAAGIWLEGVNFAMGSGMVAGAGDRPGDRPRGTVAGADLAARYREALAGAPSCCRTTASSAAPPTWCCPTGCSGSTRAWPRTSSSACSAWTTPSPSPVSAASCARSSGGPVSACATSPATPTARWRAFG